MTTRKQIDATKAHQQLQAEIANRLMGVGPGLAATFESIGQSINLWMHHQGFWASSNAGEKYALMHSELSEGMEANRKDLASDKIEGFSGEEEELADTIIRILDYAYENDLRLGDALVAKMLVNLQRPFMHGKKY